ncbi:MAG: hypothetical protein IJ846_08090 [Alphaproteobacteria bacterium]|nr:hypothetical protein [Alphaproteobacteria bacterium]
MGKLRNAFEKQDTQDTQEENSFLGRLFSSPLIRGFYKDEKPVIDVKLAGNKNEQLRMTHLINTIANNSPTGRKILEDAAKAGYSFGFETQPGSYGFCCEEDKVIRLNPMTKDAKLVATLAHEARHAQQHINGIESEFCTFDVATELKLRRATEADAQAAAAQTALEIRAATQSEKIWNAFQRTDSDIAMSVEKPSIFKSVESVVENREKNMLAAFKGWFKNWRIIEAYEQGYLYGHLMQAGRCSNPEEAKKLFEEKPFDGHKTSAEILQMVCTTDKGKCYFANDLDIMDRDSRMCGMRKETRSAADMFFREREKVTGKAPDTSYRNLPDCGGLFMGLEMAMKGMVKLETPSGKKQQPNLTAISINRMRSGR